MKDGVVVFSLIKSFVSCFSHISAVNKNNDRELFEISSDNIYNFDGSCLAITRLGDRIAEPSRRTRPSTFHGVYYIMTIDNNIRNILFY